MMKMTARLGLKAMIGALLPAIAVAALVMTTDTRQVHAEDLSGPAILTVTGDLGRPNRGPFDPAIDKFFGYNEDEFAAATSFDYEMLERLDIVKVRADFPMGGNEHVFEGPTLASVLDAAGAKGETLVLKALDGYAIEVPVSELLRKGAVLALRRDGKALGIGDFGPVHLVFPRAEREDLKTMNDDHWIWSIYHIRVE